MPIRSLQRDPQDTGPGIPSHLRDRIFEPFFTTKSDQGGTGLGLALAHRIIIGHGGALTVDSQLGQGTIFTLYLPYSAPSTTGPMIPADISPIALQATSELLSDRACQSPP